ncbi:MAG: hypothetical protein P4M08_14030 [Oligoflexia bacterium]|nr:hypothetical protein [Oligoflexia bacterium]
MSNQLSQTNGSLQATQLKMQDTYNGLRQVEAVRERQISLQDMESAKTIEGKISAAGVYMMAYEFQVWSADGSDTQEERDLLFSDAFIEFDKDLRNYLGAQPSTDPTSSAPAMMNLYAIAATLHMENAQQIALLQKNPSIPKATMLSLIESVLRRNQLLQAGKISWNDLKPYEQQALANYKDLEYILQLRANLVPMLVLSKLTSLEYAGFVTKFLDLSMGFTADLQDLSVAETDTYTQYMQDANDTRDFLKSINVDPQYNWKLERLYHVMKLPALPNTDTPQANALPAFVDQVTAFKQAL